MLKEKSSLSCCLSHIGESFSINLNPEAIPQEVIQFYEAKKVVKLDHPFDLFGFEVTEDVTVYGVEVVQLPNGKFAFPVYEVIQYYQPDEPWKSREGVYELVGWCVRDNDPFDEYKM